MPLSHQHSPFDVGRLDLGRDRDQDQVLSGTGVCHCSVAILKPQACEKLCTLCLYLFGVFYNSGITQTLILDRSAIMPF